MFFLIEKYETCQILFNRRTIELSFFDFLSKFFYYIILSVSISVTALQLQENSQSIQY